MREPVGRRYLMDAERPEPDVCLRCGASFRCGMTAGDQTCWCWGRPPIGPSADPHAGCYCPGCLDELSALRSRPQP